MLRYLKGIVHFGLIYKKGKKNFNILGYSDRDFASDIENRKSTISQVFFLGGLSIPWNSLKQKVVVLSSCEVKHIPNTSVSCQGIWIAR